MPAASNLPQIDLTIEKGGWPREAELLEMVEAAVKVAADIASLQWPEGAELSLLFTNDAHMAEINGQWRGKPKPTNVLSFPGADIAVGEEADFAIGDLVFAFETVRREADEQAKTFEDHFRHLVVHGFLHLFGYDHLEDDEAEEMENLEIQALSSLGIANPYA